MPQVSFVKGFPLSVTKLDEFLESNNLDPTEGSRIWPDEMKEISKLFREKGVDGDINILRAGRLGFQRARDVFVCCDWVHVFASKKVDGCLDKPIPAGFDALRVSLGVDTEIGSFIVFNEEVAWIPEPLLSTEETERPPCDVCGDETESREDWERHRQEKHGAAKNTHPLPEY